MSPNNGMLGDTSLSETGEFRSEFVESPQAARAFVPSPELRQYLAEIKGQAQFLLYLADQIEESLEQLTSESDLCHSAFLCKVLGMYSNQLETKHQGLGERVAEACQEIYVSIREYEHRDWR
jgi:hypothetical protein